MYNIQSKESGNFYHQTQDARYSYSGFWEAEVEEKGIFLVCSDFIIRNYLKNFISHFNRPIYISSSPDYFEEEFLEELEAIKSSVSVVVYDLLRINSHAFQRLNDLKEMGDSVRVILLANQRQIPQLKEHLNSTSWNVVTKPIFPQELKASIQEALVEKGDAVVTPTTMIAARVSDQSNKGNYCHSQMLPGTSPQMDEVKMIIDQVSGTDVTILIRGESGTGKELVARTIYECSNRAGKSFTTVLCPAIPEGLLESELFGHEKGSFTGAFRRSPGKFEIANHGTIFLDEIGDIPLGLQSKLLHVLQDGKFSRIGGGETKVDVRILAATNKDLEKSVAEGTFREDLYYRLNVVAIYLPPLRSRKDDIPLFVELFLKKYNDQYNKHHRHLAPSTIQRLLDYNWPGNVRELENLIKRIVIIGNEEIVLKQYMSDNNNGKLGQISSLLSSGGDEPKARTIGGHLQQVKEDTNGSALPPLKKVAKEAQRKAEAEVILKALERTRWNRKEAAKLLKISYKAFLYKIRQCNLEEQHESVVPAIDLSDHMPLAYTATDLPKRKEEV